MQGDTVDGKRHGLIGAIAPRRRGKTSALRMVLYQMKKVEPRINIVVVAFKTEDWRAFEKTAALIFEPDELKKFQPWLLSAMYERAKRPAKDRWIVVFDDLPNLLVLNPELQNSILQFSSLGAGTGITTIVSTQFSGKDAGGTGTFANATARLIFKPSNASQGARDGGGAGLGLDQLSEKLGDALLVVNGNVTRVATPIIDDQLIEQLHGSVPAREWLHKESQPQHNYGTLPTSVGLHPNELLIEKLNGWLLEEGVFDWGVGRFNNRSEALRQLEWSNNGRNVAKLAELEYYIFERQVSRR